MGSILGPLLALIWRHDIEGLDGGYPVIRVSGTGQEWGQDMSPLWTPNITPKWTIICSHYGAIMDGIVVPIMVPLAVVGTGTVDQHHISGGIMLLDHDGHHYWPITTSAVVVGL